MTVKKHHVVKYPHMRQLRLAPHHALHDTSIIHRRSSNLCAIYITYARMRHVYTYAPDPVPHPRPATAT